MCACWHCWRCLELYILLFQCIWSYVTKYVLSFPVFYSILSTWHNLLDHELKSVFLCIMQRRVYLTQKLNDPHWWLIKPTLVSGNLNMTKFLQNWVCEKTGRNVSSVISEETRKSSMIKEVWWNLKKLF